MEFTTGLGWVFYSFAMLGFLGTLIYSSYLIHNKKKLDSNDFTLQIFTTNTISLFLFAIGSWLIITDSMIKDGIDEPFFIKLITLTAGGGIFISMCSIILSNLVVYWKA